MYDYDKDDQKSVGRQRLATADPLQATFDSTQVTLDRACETDETHYEQLDEWLLEAAQRAVALTFYDECPDCAELGDFPCAACYIVGRKDFPPRVVGGDDA